MVPLETRLNYSSRIDESPKLKAFNNMLLGRHITYPQSQEMNESEEIYFGIVNSVNTNNRTEFEKYYNKKSKSNPSKESPAPFVNDDFLLFCLISGILKFDLDRQWIKKIISIKTRNSITITLENILNENFYSKSNLAEIVLVYAQLHNPSLIKNELLNDAYKSVTENISLFENKSDFHILCANRAYDIVLEFKGSYEGSEIQLLKDFKSNFLKRIRILTWFMRTGVFVLLLYGLVNLISRIPQIKRFFENYDAIFTTLGVLGLSLLGNFIPLFNKMSYEFILRLFGYPKQLIVKDKEQKK